jgi:hypothetical protein
MCYKKSAGQHENSPICYKKSGKEQAFSVKVRIGLKGRNGVKSAKKTKCDISQCVSVTSVKFCNTSVTEKVSQERDLIVLLPCYNCYHTYY